MTKRELINNRENFMKLILSIFAVFTFFNVYAEPLNNAELAFKIPLAKEPSTRPMTVAFIPAEKKYYIADGGLAPIGGEPFSKSQIHVYSEDGSGRKCFLCSRGCSSSRLRDTGRSRRRQ